MVLPCVPSGCDGIYSRLIWSRIPPVAIDLISHALRPQSIWFRVPFPKLCFSCLPLASVWIDLARTSCDYIDLTRLPQDGIDLAWAPYDWFYLPWPPRNWIDLTSTARALVGLACSPPLSSCSHRPSTRKHSVARIGTRYEMLGNQRSNHLRGKTLLRSSFVHDISTHTV